MQEERLSLRAQSKRLKEYAERRELDVIKRFEIIESSTRGERKRFMEMINFCKKQKETIAIEIQPKAFCTERFNHLRKNGKGLSLRRSAEKKILFVGGLLHQNRAEAIHPGTRCFKHDRNHTRPYQSTGFLNKSVV